MSQRGLRIFICEDDPGILEVVGIALKTEGHEPIPHNTLDGLEERIFNEKPEILLLDLWLEGANGKEMLARLVSNKQIRKTRIVLMSAHSSLPDIAKEHGVDYLMKPFSLEDLWSAIARNTQ